VSDKLLIEEHLVLSATAPWVDTPDLLLLHHNGRRYVLDWRQYMMGRELDTHRTFRPAAAPTGYVGSHCHDLFSCLSRKD
jgi:hypothetical protein